MHCCVKRPKKEMGNCGAKPGSETERAADGGLPEAEKPAPAAEPAKPAPAPAAPDAAAPAPTPETPAAASEAPALDAAGLKRVVDLFKLWDIDSAGKLELKAFTEASMQVGSHEVKLLSRLADMDFDGDGFITDEEWQKRFTAMAGALSADEFDLVMTEMGDAADNMVALIRCTRLAAEADAVPADTSEAAPAELTGDRIAAVEKLFKAWDFEDKGSIDKKKVTEAAVSFGPNKSRMMQQLESMDTDGDGVVTLTEMKVFFQVVSPNLSDGDFAAVIGEMEELAAEAATIASCLMLAAADPTVEMDAAEIVKPTLPTTRQELLGKLFGLFTEDPTQSIDVANLEKCTIKEGPHETKLLKDLKTMDANSDGQLTLEEMTDYFAVLGLSLSDDEFELIIGEMFTVCSNNQLAAQLAAFAASV